MIPVDDTQVRRMSRRVVTQQRGNKMLQAVLKGKLRGDVVQGPEGSWLSAAIKLNEDLLSSSVFARLTYLSDATLCRVLIECAQPDLVARTVFEDPGALREVLFWPQLRNSPNDAAAQGTRCEPDLILKFERLWVVIEAKLDSNHQSARQWADEVSVAVAGMEDENQTVPVCLLAVGGFERFGVKNQVSTLRTDAIRLVEAGHRSSGSATFLGCSWHQLLAAVLNARWATNLSHEMRILEDVVSALDLYNVRPTTWLETLSPVQFEHGSPNHSVETMSRWTREAREGATFTRAQSP